MDFERFIDGNVLILANARYSDYIMGYIEDRFENLIVLRDMSFEEVFQKIDSVKIMRDHKIFNILNGGVGEPRVLIDMSSLHSNDKKTERYVHHKSISRKLSHMFGGDIKFIVINNVYKSVTNPTSSTGNLIGGTSLLYDFPYAISVDENIKVVKNRDGDSDKVLVENTQKFFRNIKLNELISDEGSK